MSLVTRQERACPVDPQIAGLLELLAAADTPMSQMSPEEARASFAALALSLRPPEAVLPMREVVEVTVPGAEVDLPARVYRPRLDGPLPTVVMFHGGGWVIGDLEHPRRDGTLDRPGLACRRRLGGLSAGARSGRSPRLPRTRWPRPAGRRATSPVSVATTRSRSPVTAPAATWPRWLPSSWGPGSRSAAGLPRHRRRGRLWRALPSRVENGTGYFLDTATMQWFQQHYAGHLVQDDPLLSPMLGTHLAGVAPAVVVTAELDPLRDEGETYAEKLRSAGVRVLSRRYDGMIHGFFDLGVVSAAAAVAVEETCAMFAEVLHA